MSDHATKIRVIKPQDITWEEAMRYPEETDPAGKEFTATQSMDDKFSTGLWQCDVQRRHFERPYHEIAFIIEGEVEITDDDGNVVTAGPGDILITPTAARASEEPHAREEILGHLRGIYRAQRLPRLRQLLSRCLGGRRHAPAAPRERQSPRPLPRRRAEEMATMGSGLGLPQTVSA